MVYLTELKNAPKGNFSKNKPYVNLTFAVSAANRAHNQWNLQSIALGDLTIKINMKNKLSTFTKQQTATGHYSKGFDYSLIIFFKNSATNLLIVALFQQTLKKKKIPKHFLIPTAPWTETTGMRDVILRELQPALDSS